MLFGIKKLDWWKPKWIVEVNIYWPLWGLTEHMEDGDWNARGISGKNHEIKEEIKEN